VFERPLPPESSGPARPAEIDRRRRLLTEAAFLIVSAGVVLLLVAPRLPLHGVRRLGGGLLLGFGLWLDVAANREWKELATARPTDRPLTLAPLPRRFRSGIVTGLALGLLLLEFAHRR
jgi:hypothetical protein